MFEANFSRISEKIKPFFHSQNVLDKLSLMEEYAKLSLWIQWNPSKADTISKKQKCPL